MFNLFVLGSVQKPAKSIVDAYLPDINFFAAKSHFVATLVEAHASGADSAKIRKIATGYDDSPGKDKDAIYRSEAQLAGKYPLLERMLEAHHSGDVEALIAAFEAVKSKGRDALCGGAPALFASMTAGYVLNQRHAAVDRIVALIKMAAASLIMIDNPGKYAGAKAMAAFVREYMGKAIPRVSVAPTVEPAAAFPLGPAPTDRDQPAPISVDHSQQFSALAEVHGAIGEIEQLLTMRTIEDRSAPPALSDFARIHRPQEEVTSPAVGAKARKPPTAQSTEQAIKADFEKAIGAHARRTLRKDDIARMTPATRKLLQTIAGPKGEVQADEAIAKLRVSHQAISTSILDAPVRYDRYVDQVLVGGHVVQIDRNVFDAITCVERPKICHCKLLQDLDARHGSLPQLYVLGTGTSYRIDTTFSRYIRGELVHTEPVVGGSKRTMSFRLLNRTEDEVETFVSNEEEQEQEASSDERFRMEKEMEAETRSEVAMNMGASVTAGYGPVSLSANFGMSSSSATQSKEKQALETAQQKTSRAMSRIRKKTETRTLSKRISENERTSGFTLDNEDKPSFTAYFHAIDAEYSNQLVSIGTRMVVRVCMQEFMAPLLHCLMTEPEGQKFLKQPIAPDKIPNPLLNGKILKNFSDIKTDNYAMWLALFNISNAPPPPDNLTASAHAHGSPGASWNPGGGSIPVPDGYIAYYGVCTLAWSGGSYLEIILANTYLGTSGGSCNLNLTGSVPWAYRGNAGDSFTLDIVIHCKPNDAKIAEWQMRIFDLIWTQYRRELSDYENSLQMAKIEAGISFSGRNPRKNEMFVREELMKMVLGATFPQFFYRGLNSMKFGYKCIGKDENGQPITVGPPIPEPDFLDAKAEAPWVTFMSKLYEFENMTFDLKPYFFGNRAKWCSLRKIADVDPRMEAALSAGYVTIDIPVALGMETAFMHYMATGQIWNGNGMPIIGDPLYEALAIEIMNGQNPAGLPVGQPWKTVLPTSLVMVSDDAPADL